MISKTKGSCLAGEHFGCGVGIDTSNLRILSPYPSKAAICVVEIEPPKKRKKNIFTQRNCGLLPSTKLTYPVANRASEQGKSMVGVNSLLVSGRVPSTKLTQQWKILNFPGKYHQNGGCSIA